MGVGEGEKAEGTGGGEQEAQAVGGGSFADKQMLQDVLRKKL